MKFVVKRKTILSGDNAWVTIAKFARQVDAQKYIANCNFQTRGYLKLEILEN